MSRLDELADPIGQELRTSLQDLDWALGELPRVMIDGRDAECLRLWLPSTRLVDTVAWARAVHAVVDVWRGDSGQVTVDSFGRLPVLGTVKVISCPADAGGLPDGACTPDALFVLAGWGES